MGRGDVYHPLISVVIVDSRSIEHPDWVSMCLNSIKHQTYSNIELIKIDNTDHSMSIGKAFNTGVQQAHGEYCLFVGDDDYISNDYVASLVENVKSLRASGHAVRGLSTYKTIFTETARYTAAKPVQGMWERQLLLEYPYDETLTVRVDHYAIMGALGRGEQFYVIPHQFGYFHRKHDTNTSILDHAITAIPDIYILANPPSFAKDFVPYFQGEGYDAKLLDVSVDMGSVNAKKAVIKDWADAIAVAVAQLDLDCKKILRLHAQEAFDQDIFHIDFSRFDSVVFVAKHILKEVERLLGNKIPNSVIIPHGANIEKFTIADNKQPNKEIAIIGTVDPKKGIQLLLEVARFYPHYNFHFAGRCAGQDIQVYCDSHPLPNIKFYGDISPDQLNAFLSDKTYIMNGSPREGFPVSVAEGMAAGLIPVIHNWDGATDIYGKEYIWSSINQIQNILEQEVIDYNPSKYREFIINNKLTLLDTMQAFHALID